MKVVNRKKLTRGEWVVVQGVDTFENVYFSFDDRKTWVGAFRESGNAQVRLPNLPGSKITVHVRVGESGAAIDAGVIDIL